MLCELQYVGDVDVINETIKALRNKARKWNEAFESKGLKVNPEKTRVMVGRVTKIDELSKRKIHHYI